METSQKFRPISLRTVDIVDIIKTTRANGDVGGFVVYDDGIWRVAISINLGGWIQYVVNYRYKDGRSGTTAVEIVPDTLCTESRFQLKKAVQLKILDIHKKLNGIK